MSYPTGTVQSLRSDESGVRAIVKVDAREICPRCAAGKGCGAGLFGGSKQPRTVAALVAEPLKLDTGDTVELKLAPANVLSAAFIVYGLPLLGALIAAGTAYLLQFGDAAAAAAAMLGMMGGLLAGRHKLRRTDCINDLVPTVEKKLHNAHD